MSRRRALDREINQYLASVPDAATVRFKRNGCPRQTDSLRVRDRKNLVLETSTSLLPSETVG